MEVYVIRPVYTSPGLKLNQLRVNMLNRFSNQLTLTTSRTRFEAGLEADLGQAIACNWFNG